MTQVIETQLQLPTDFVSSSSYFAPKDECPEEPEEILWLKLFPFICFFVTFVSKEEGGEERKWSKVGHVLQEKRVSIRISIIDCEEKKRNETLERNMSCFSSWSSSTFSKEEKGSLSVMIHSLPSPKTCLSPSLFSSPVLYSRLFRLPFLLCIQIPVSWSKKSRNHAKKSGKNGHWDDPAAKKKTSKKERMQSNCIHLSLFSFRLERLFSTCCCQRESVIHSFGRRD